MTRLRVACSVVAAFAGVVALGGCGMESHPVDGVVVQKVYAPECTTTEIMGTASGPLAYDDDHSEEWFVVVEQEDAYTARVLVSEEEFNAIKVGDAYKVDDHVWPYQPRLSECEENFDVES